MVRYVGCDVHRQTVVFCILTADGRLLGHFTVGATRADLEGFAREHLTAEDHLALEATFSCWAVLRVLSPSTSATTAPTKRRGASGGQREQPQQGGILGTDSASGRTHHGIFFAGQTRFTTFTRRQSNSFTKSGADAEEAPPRIPVPRALISGAALLRPSPRSGNVELQPGT